MSKVLRTIAKVATVIGAVAKFIPGVGQVISAVATGVALVAGVASEATAKKPPAPGTTNQFTIDPQAGIPYCIGRTFTGGRIIHVDGYGGADNPNLTYVIAFTGGGPAVGIETVLVERQPVTVGPGGASGYYAGFMWFAHHLGGHPEASALAAPFAGFPNWSPAHRLSGYTTGMWTLKFDKKGKVFASGQPEFGVVGRWVRVYDPRLDSTIPGGNGPCRARQENTYVWSENGPLHALTWALGRWQNGRRALGVGIEPQDIDIQAFIDAANIFDANGWAVGGVMDGSADKWNTLRTILLAGAAEPLDLGGLLSCRYESPKVSLATITGDDLADGEIVVPAMKTWRDRINSIIPRYRSEAHNWEIIPASAVRGAAYIAEDGEERTRESEYYCCQSLTQAAQLAAYEIARSREIDGISIPLKTKFIGYKPGDCLTLNIPEANLNNQPAVVTNRTLDPATGIVTMTFRTETAAKHAWAMGRTASAPPSPAITSSALADALIWSNRAGVPEERFNPFERYDFGRIVNTANGARYIYISDTPSVGTAPPNVARWSLLSGSAVVDVAQTLVNQGPGATDPRGLAPIYDNPANLVFDGGFRLMGSRWTLGAWAWSPGAHDGPFLQIATGGTQVAFSGVIGIAGNINCSLQAELFTGGMTGGTLNLDIQWRTAAGTLIAQTTERVTQPNGQGWNKRRIQVTSPVGTAQGIVRVFIEGATNTNAAVRRIKLSQGWMDTPFSDDVTNSAIYNNGQNIDALRPQEFGANVTEGRVSSAVANQGALAVLNNVGASRLLLPGYDNIIPDADYRDLAWWGAASFPNIQGIGVDLSWDQNRVLEFTCDRDMNIYSQFFAVELGSTYRVRCRIWNNDTNRGWTGAFWPLIHMPSVAWWSLRHGYAVDPNIANAANAIVANGDTGMQEFYFRVSSTTMRMIQFAFLSNARGSHLAIQIQINKVAQLGRDIMRNGSAARYNVNELETALGVASSYFGQTAWGTFSGSTNRVARINDAGRIIDPTMYNTQFMIGPRNATTLSPGYTVGGSNVTVTLPAHSRMIAGASGPIALSYGAMSAAWPFGSYWAAYVDDPNLTGIASPAVALTSDPNQLLFPGRYQVASGFTPAANGTGGITGLGGGGGIIANCVAADSFMPDGRRAGEYEAGDLLWVLCEDSWSQAVCTRVAANKVVEDVECAELVSASGIKVVASVSTPCTLRGGQVVNILDALGEELAVQDHNGFRWEKIVKVTRVGQRAVAHISANDRTYAAGTDYGRYIFVHNSFYKP